LDGEKIRERNCKPAKKKTNWPSSGRAQDGSKECIADLAQKKFIAKARENLKGWVGSRERES